MSIELLCLRLKRRILKRLKRDTNDVSIEILRNRGVDIGSGCRLFSQINTGEPYLISIGNNVTISTGVNLITHDNCAIKIFPDGTDFVGKIRIGDNCFIGAGSIILPGVTLGENTVVAAGSVVTKSFLSPGVVIGGNPAKQIGTTASLADEKKSNVFNFRGLNAEEKKKEILGNPQKWIKK